MRSLKQLAFLANITALPRLKAIELCREFPRVWTEDVDLFRQVLTLLGPQDANCIDVARTRSDLDFPSGREALFESLLNGHKTKIMLPAQFARPETSLWGPKPILSEVQMLFLGVDGMPCKVLVAPKGQLDTDMMRTLSTSMAASLSPHEVSGWSKYVCIIQVANKKPYRVIVPNLGDACDYLLHKHIGCQESVWMCIRGVTSMRLSSLQLESDKDLKCRHHSWLNEDGTWTLYGFKLNERSVALDFKGDLPSDGQSLILLTLHTYTKNFFYKARDRTIKWFALEGLFAALIADAKVTSVDHVEIPRSELVDIFRNPKGHTKILIQHPSRTGTDVVSLDRYVFKKF